MAGPDEKRGSPSLPRVLSIRPEGKPTEKEAAIAFELQAARNALYAQKAVVAKVRTGSWFSGWFAASCGACVCASVAARDARWLLGAAVAVVLWALVTWRANEWAARGGLSHD